MGYKAWKWDETTPTHLVYTVGGCIRVRMDGKKVKEIPREVMTVKPPLPRDTSYVDPYQEGSHGRGRRTG